MTAAVPLPQPEVPATAADLGHPLRYPVEIVPDAEYRSGCSCHWWELLDVAEAKAWLAGGFR